GRGQAGGGGADLPRPDPGHRGPRITRHRIRPLSQPPGQPQASQPPGQPAAGSAGRRVSWPPGQLAAARGDPAAPSLPVPTSSLAAPAPPPVVRSPVVRSPVVRSLVVPSPGVPRPDVPLPGG